MSVIFENVGALAHSHFRDLIHAIKSANLQTGVRLEGRQGLQVPNLGQYRASVTFMAL